MDKTLIQDQITGLKAKVKDLRDKEKIFIKAQGLQEQEEKLRADAQKLRTDVAFLKTSNKKLEENKNKIVNSSTEPLANKINSLLPEGNAIVDVSEDGNFFLGWEMKGNPAVPYAGLSGGEKATFDAALAVALKANLVICEFAELDAPRFTSALEKINGDIQSIALSCHEPEKVPAGWDVVRL